MDVQFNRDSSDGTDDAHTLNWMIMEDAKKRQNLSSDFVAEWTRAYQAYCATREPITLSQGLES